MSDAGAHCDARLRRGARHPSSPHRTRYFTNTFTHTAHLRGGPAMLRWIIDSSLRFRLLILVVAAGVLALGVARLHEAPVDVLPEFTPPYVEIQTEALGLSAAEVEQFITVPLEADLLNGVEGVDVLRSQSVPSMSSIVMVFRPEFDVYRARQLVQERLTQVGAAAFPNVSKPPTMLPALSSSSRVLMVGLGSERLSGIEKSVIARWTVRPRLMGVPGVANLHRRRDRQPRAGRGRRRGAAGPRARGVPV